MVRLLAYALNVNADNPAHQLAFTKGLSATDEPALWAKDLTGAIALWVDVGLPDERRLRQACGKANRVLVYAYGRTQAVWWKGLGGKIGKLRNLRIISLDAEATTTLAALAARNMTLNIHVQDQTAWVHSAQGEASLELTPLYEGPGA